MNESALISVIMPVYNPGKYLHTAIMGILNQSYENLELICIDDASVDGSAQILMQYQKGDERIRLIHHSENTGAACARNEGIDSAYGKYIFFADADDAFEENMLKYMVEAAERKRTDMVYINQDTFVDGEPYGADIRGDYYYFGKWFSKWSEKEKCPKGLLRSFPTSSSGRLYSTEFIRKSNLRFQNLKSSNDVYFGIMATALAQKIAFLEEQVNLVHVRVHGGKNRISNQRNPYDNFRAYSYLKQEMEKRRLPDKEIEMVQERFLDNTLWELKGCSLEKREAYYQFIVTEGLKEMGISQDRKIVTLDPVYRRIVESFQTKPFENKWIEDLSNGYRTEKWKEKIIDLFRQIKRQGRMCAIWGAGKDGRLIADICVENQCQCEGFIDRDKEKWGENLSGYKIFAPENLLGVIDTVIVLNQRYFNEIYDWIKVIRGGISMVSLNMYLQYEQDLYSSTITVSK